jgi:DNA-binding NtrC family response regulator
VGGTQELRSTVRLIFATNKNLKQLVKEGKFREDLYARICHFTIQMPALKDRKEDIPQICQNLTEQLSLDGPKNISFNSFPEPLQKFFLRKEFPYNIRGIKADLEHLLMYCPAMSSGKLNYSSWRSILNDSKKSVKDNLSSKKLDDVLDAIVEKMGTTDWPGYKRLGERLEEKLCKKLISDIPSNKERAKLLGMSEGNACIKIKKYKKLNQMELEV